MVNLRDESGVQVLKKYSYDFEDNHPYSYIVLKEGTGETSSPIYAVLEYAVDKNSIYNKQTADSVLKSRKYSNFGQQHFNLICNLIDLEEGEGRPKTVMGKIWRNLHACQFDLNKFQYVMLDIGEDIQTLSEDDVYSAINREPDTDDESEDDDEDETRERYKNDNYNDY